MRSIDRVEYYYSCCEIYVYLEVRVKESRNLLA